MYMLLFMLAMMIGMLMPEFLNEPSEAEQAIRETFPETSVRGVVLMMGVVAIWEEIAFRGFLLTRLHAIFRHWLPAVLVGSIAFGAIHIYEGLLAVVVIVFMGLILAGLFLWRRSLVPCIVMHFLHNTLVMMILFGNGGQE
jgi:membrane protease YdiL (CAAX protease family)